MRIHAALPVLFLAWACGPGSDADAAATQEDDASTCVWNDLEELIAVDTASMERFTRRVMGLSTEGGEAIIYHDDGSTKVVRVSLLGETGRSDFAFFLMSNDTFVADVKIYQYESPVSTTDLQPDIGSVYHRVHYVCDGQEMTDAPAIAPSLPDLRTILGEVVDSPED